MFFEYLQRFPESCTLLRSIRFILALIITSSVLSHGQGLRQMQVYKAVDKISIDGEMTEESWKLAPAAHSFYLNSPNDTAAPSSQTEVRMVFDDKSIYFYAIMYDESPSPYVVESLRRDWNFSRTDNFSIYIDPFDDKTTGFSFGISPYGAQREGLIFEGGGVQTDWDNVWYSDVKIEEGYWAAEIKIPYKTIRYNEKSKFWNVIFLRNDLKFNEVSTWTPVPQQFNGSNLGFSGTLNFVDSLPKPGPNISLIPYIAGGETRNFEESDRINQIDIGGDAKIGITPSLNLDLTFNPDFSQVEVDRQVTNLERFELFFPERRQFFLENNDLFGRFGYPSSRVFFSRRIGLDRPIIYGARLSGKANDKMRVGFLNMQEGSEITRDTMDNATVGIFQRKIFGRSNISGIFVNRQGYRSFSDSLANQGFLNDDYNRVAGLEYNLLSNDGKWEGDIYYFNSFTKEKQTNNFAQGAFLGYNTRNLFVGYSHEFIGENYQLDLGFLPRRGFYRVGPSARYRWYPNKNGVIFHGPRAYYNIWTDQEFTRTDQYYGLEYNVRFLNTSELFASYDNSYVLLTDTFRIGFVQDFQDTLVPGEEFKWDYYKFYYNTDTRKRLWFLAGAETGGFFSARRHNGTAEVNWRFQPFGSFSVRVEYNYLDLTGGGKDGGNFLISPRLDLTLSDKIFLTTFVQYNEQINNFNINSRLQWRFKPVSDFFIVYTENYFSDTFVAKSRALVFKLTYWLNV